MTLTASAVVLAFSVNWIYQVARKPTELFFPVGDALLKTPEATWASYAPLFRRHSTVVMTPELLAALAQVEGFDNPSHAVEMTSALLDRQIADVLARHGIRQPTLAQRQRLAAVIHLCGAGAKSAYARRGLDFAPGQRCGSHDPRHYVANVEAMRQTFARLVEG